MSDIHEQEPKLESIPWSVLTETFGCCGVLKQGPFCQKCGKRIDRLESLLSYVTDRIENIKIERNKTKLPMWIGWQHALIETLRAIAAMKETQRRGEFLKAADKAYRDLKSDNAEWMEELSERQAWNGISNNRGVE